MSCHHHSVTPNHYPTCLIINHFSTILSAILTRCIRLKTSALARRFAPRCPCLCSRVIAVHRIGASLASILCHCIARCWIRCQEPGYPPVSLWVFAMRLTFFKVRSTVALTPREVISIGPRESGMTSPEAVVNVRLDCAVARRVQLNPAPVEIRLPRASDYCHNVTHLLVARR